MRSLDDALQAGEERMRLALDAAGMGSFVWYPGEDRGDPDARMLALFGLEPDSTLNLAVALATLIHPDDRERYADAVARVVDPAGDGELKEDIRVLRPDGEERCIAVTARTSFEGDPPRAVRLAGVAADVTSQREAEEALRESESALRASEKRYRTLFDSIDEGFCVIEVIFDETGRSVDYLFHETNPAFVGQTGLQDVVGRRMREIEPAHEEHWFEIYGRIAAGGEPERFTNRARALGDRWFDVFAFPVGEPSLNQVAVLFTDVSDRKRAETALRQRAASQRNARQQAELLADLVGELEAVDGVRNRARRLVDLLVERVADYAAIELPDDRVVADAGSGGPTLDVLLSLGIDASGTLHLRPRHSVDPAFMAEIAERAGLLLGRARLHEAERWAALRLQRALLPNNLVQHPSVSIAARYEVGGSALEVGGDWFDSFTLPDGRIAVAVGDVVGHGLDAAATMGRLRTALAALAGDAADPGELLTKLDVFAAGPDGVPYATVCFAILDPLSGRLEYAMAGHPPMLRVSESGAASWLEGGTGVPLGIGWSEPREHASATLAARDGLVLFTDGLVERRLRPIDTGLERLLRAVQTHWSLPVDEVCDRIVAELEVAGTDDDVVLMVLRRTPIDTPVSTTAARRDLGS